MRIRNNFFIFGFFLIFYYQSIFVYIFFVYIYLFTLYIYLNRLKLPSRQPSTTLSIREAILSLFLSRYKTCVCYLLKIDTILFTRNVVMTKWRDRSDSIDRTRKYNVRPRPVKNHVITWLERWNSGYACALCDKSRYRKTNENPPVILTSLSAMSIPENWIWSLRL